MTSVVHSYEADYNVQHSGAVERSRAEKRVLERQQKQVEDLVVKGKATMDDLDENDPFEELPSYTILSLKLHNLSGLICVKLRCLTCLASAKLHVALLYANYPRKSL